MISGVAAVSCLSDTYMEMNLVSYSDFEFYHPIEQFGADSIYVEGMFTGGASSVSSLVFASHRSGDGGAMTGGFGLTMKKDTLNAGEGYLPFTDKVNQYPMYTAYGTRTTQGENMCAVFRQSDDISLMPEHDIVFLDAEYGTCTPQFCRINNTYQMVSYMMSDDSSYRFDKGDYLKLTVRGYLGGKETGSVEYCLADFRSADNNGEDPDSLLTVWKSISLTKLGQVDNIDFELESSRRMPGLSFCLDNFAANIYVKK